MILTNGARVIAIGIEVGDAKKGAFFAHPAGGAGLPVGASVY